MGNTWKCEGALQGVCALHAVAAAMAPTVCYRLYFLRVAPQHLFLFRHWQGSDYKCIERGVCELDNYSNAITYHGAMSLNSGGRLFNGCCGHVTRAQVCWERVVVGNRFCMTAAGTGGIWDLLDHGIPL